MVGDLDNNSAQEFADAVAYVEGILGDDLSPMPCTDIDQDGEMTVSDAALMSACQWYNEAHSHPDSSGVHDKCAFPVQEITNIFDAVHFMVGDVNWGMGYFDVHVLNAHNRIVGYELDFSGVSISDAVSLADPSVTRSPRHLSRGQQGHWFELRWCVISQKPRMGAAFEGVLERA